MRPFSRPGWIFEELLKPRLVAEISFAEWTGDGKLRQPVYLGLGDDKKAQDVHREA